MDDKNNNDMKKEISPQAAQTGSPALDALMGMRIIDMTGRQFLELHALAAAAAPAPVTAGTAAAASGNTAESQYVRGIRGLARFLDVSESTVSRYRKDGIFDDAIIRYKGVIYFDKAKSLERFRNMPSQP